jgi:16S rRNA (cytosine967-C5)-methyltransferase
VSRYYSYLNSAKQILQLYQGNEPFASFLKKFFNTNKKYGSKDRKMIGHLCYCFFRLGKSLQDEPSEERILAGLLLCSIETNEMLQQLKPEWDRAVTLSIEEKCSILNAQFSTLNVFPWKEELSDGVDHEKFSESFFVQPNLFLRPRPGYENSVKEKLSDAEIKFDEISSDCLSLPNATKIEKIVELDKEAVVQDYSSQKTGALIKSAISNLQSEIKVWDCCAGSGGKSLLAIDLNPEIDLTVSDSRKSIIFNFKKRFASAGIKNYKSFVTDLADPHSPFTTHHSPFDLIICDAPCTGSGTWGRTPEQLYFFDEKKIGQYSSLQKKIISNTIPQLKAGGYFLYITCSVFKKENEGNADFIKKEFHLEIVKMELLKGYDKKADSLFAALFRKITA